MSISRVYGCFPRWAKSPDSLPGDRVLTVGDRKSTRLNSSHSQISYAVFCLKKKKNIVKEDLYPTYLKSSHIQIPYDVTELRKPSFDGTGQVSSSPAESDQHWW